MSARAQQPLKDLDPPARKLEVRLRDDGVIELRQVGSRSWTATSRTRLARDYAAEHPVWVELRARGVRRPSPGSTTASDRERRFYGLRLAADEARRLDELAARRGLTRRDLVVRLLEDAEAQGPADATPVAR